VLAWKADGLTRNGGLLANEARVLLSHLFFAGARLNTF
jgi:hypothetical protein